MPINSKPYYCDYKYSTYIPVLESQNSIQILIRFFCHLLRYQLKTTLFLGQRIYIYGAKYLYLCYIYIYINIFIFMVLKLKLYNY